MPAARGREGDKIMKLYLVHHAHALSAEQNPVRPLSEQGHAEADRLGRRLKAEGAAPVRILHSDKRWTQETAERLAASLGMSERAALAGYAIGPDDDLTPFLAEIDDCDGDLMMTGHGNYLVRTAAKLVCGDEARTCVEFKPGNGTVFCLEGGGGHWVVAWGWRQEQLAD